MPAAIEFENRFVLVIVLLIVIGSDLMPQEFEPRKITSTITITCTKKSDGLRCAKDGGGFRLCSGLCRSSDGRDH